MKKQKLILDQIERKIQLLKKVGSITIPSSGWVYAIRMALGMSLRQAGSRMGITAQSVKDLEEREKAGSISLNVLRQFGKSLDMTLIYGFIPTDKNLETLIEKRALILAREIVNRTSISMKLEDQQLSPERIEKAINEKAEELKREMPRYLWN